MFATLKRAFNLIRKPRDVFVYELLQLSRGKLMNVAWTQKCWTGLEEEPVTESLVPFFRGWLLQHIATSVLAQKTAKSSPYLAPVLQY